MRIALVLALVLTATGCPDDDGDGSGYVTIEQVPAAYKDAICQYYVRCGQFADQAACLGASFLGGYALDPNDVGAIRAGRAQYLGGNVKACFDAIAHRSCDKTSLSWREPPAACAEVVRGTLGAGASCFVNAECISQQCEGAQSDVSCFAGQCVGDQPPTIQRGAIGEYCTQSEFCATGGYCDTAILKCAALIHAGMPCTSSDECAYGLGCGGSTGARVCKALPMEGESCPDGICRDDAQYCSATTTCKKVGLPPSACTTSAECSLFYPCDFATNMCKQGPALGQSCSGGTRCFEANTFCDSATLTCVALRANGGPCTNETQCTSGYCDFNAGQCAAPPTCF